MKEREMKEREMKEREMKETEKETGEMEGMEKHTTTTEEAKTMEENSPAAEMTKDQVWEEARENPEMTKDQAWAEARENPELAGQVRHQMRVIRQGAEELIGEPELEQKVARSISTGRPLIIKFGMDPSAPDIHLGHAVPLRKLKQMQDLGHTIVIVIGDFTAKIGDPTGKSKGRKAMTEQEVFLNAQTYQEQIFRILDREKTQVRFNGEWLELLNLNEVLQLASTVTVARMLERDDFQNRFRGGIPIGLHEFFYPLMQAYDSVELKADLELGGTDQTFNILMGRQLQRDRKQEPQAAMFMPLLEGIDGVEKMSKSLGNYIGISEDARTMFIKVMQVPDALIVKYFELATDILPEDLDKIKEALADGCNPRDCKLVLAKTITSLYHSPEDTAEAENFFREAFTDRKVPDQAEILEAVLESGTLFDCVRPLVNAGIVESGAQFRRLIAQGGVQKNGVRVNQLEEPVQSGDVLKVGKRRFVQVKMC